MVTFGLSYVCQLLLLWLHLGYPMSVNFYFCGYIWAILCLSTFTFVVTFGLSYVCQLLLLWLHLGYPMSVNFYFCGISFKYNNYYHFVSVSSTLYLLILAHSSILKVFRSFLFHLLYSPLSSPVARQPSCFSCDSFSVARQPFHFSCNSSACNDQ